jgi:hypothetical protein
MKGNKHSYRYYACKLRIAVNYLLCMTMVNIILALMLVYNYNSMPTAEFYASSDVGEITLLNPMDKYKKSIL